MAIAALSIAAILGALASPAAARTFLPACGFLELEAKPAAWSPECAPGTPRFEDLSWRHWGKKRARAAGSALFVACGPPCQLERAHRYRARVLAFGKRRCRTRPRHRQYTRAKVSILYEAGNPFGQPEGWGSSTWRLGSRECRAYLPTFEQGTGIVLSDRPAAVDARRNVRPGSISGLDAWVVRKWKRFGGRRAVAVASYFWNKPDGTGFRRYRSRLIAHRIRRCTGTYVYTRITGRFLRGKPPGMGQAIRMRAYRYDC